MDEEQIISGVKELRPTKDVSYNDFAIKLEPFFKAIGELPFARESNVELPYNSWFSDFFAALCTDDTSRYTIITTASFDRACQCLGVFSDLKQFIRFLFDLIGDINLLLPQFYGFVNDDNARKLLFEENTWLLRFNNDKLLYTVCVEGDNGLELKDHEIRNKIGSYTLDGKEFSDLERLVDQFDQKLALTSSPYRAASYMANKYNYDYYSYGDEIPFRDVWSELTSKSPCTSSEFNVRLYHWYSVFYPDPQLDQLTLASIPDYVSLGAAPHVCRLLRRLKQLIVSPSDLLQRALYRTDNGINAVVDYLFSMGANPNYKKEKEDPLIIAFAQYHHQSAPVRCLLRHPSIDVNVCNSYGRRAVAVSARNPDILQLFLDDPRTDVNYEPSSQSLLEDVIMGCPKIEMMRSVIDRGFNLDKNTSKQLTQILDYRREKQDQVKGWKILVEYGVNINAVNEENRTVLHKAVLEATVADVEALLDLGANVDGSPTCPDTPLHLAAARGAVEITGLLLKRGADVNRVNEQGKKAEDLAAFATKKFFRKVVPPLEDFTFVGHRIEFAQQETPIPARYLPDLMIIGDHIYVQGGLHRKTYTDPDGDTYWNGAPMYDFWRASLGNALTKNGVSLGEWQKIQKPPRDIDHHSYESIRTINVGREIWFVGFDDLWVKYNVDEDAWSKDPMKIRAEYASYLNTYKSYNMSDHILYPTARGMFKVWKEDGSVTVTRGDGEELTKGWSHDHAMIGDNIWIKKLCTEDWSIAMYCLNTTSATWFKVGDVDRDIDGSLVAVGKYLLSTSFNSKAKEMKICVFDTDSMNWTRHAIDIKSGSLVLSRKQSMYVHKDRLILFGGQTDEETVTDAMYSIDLSPLLGVKSLAMMSATAVVANQDKLSKEAIESLPVDLKERMGFVDKK